MSTATPAEQAQLASHRSAADAHKLQVAMAEATARRKHEAFVDKLDLFINSLGHSLIRAQTVRVYSTDEFEQQAAQLHAMAQQLVVRAGELMDEANPRGV